MTGIQFRFVLGNKGITTERTSTGARRATILTDTLLAIDLPIQSLPSALTILTSMITPALLISATGTFILSTSNRLGRVVDRVRGISEKIDELMRTDSVVELADERKAMLIEQLGRLSSRADMLQRSLTVLYLASGSFVA